MGNKKHKNDFQPQLVDAEAIKNKAYELWKDDGEPDGKSEYYWSRAQIIVETERCLQKSKMSQKEVKNIWEKIEIISSLISSIGIALLTIVIGISSDKIASSISKGNLVQQLIADLTSKDDTGQRKDIALITLNHSIGENDPLFVSEIARRIFQDSESKASDARIAFDLIRQNSPELAEQLIDESFGIIDSHRREINVSQDPDRKSFLKEEIEQEKKFLLFALPHVIYIQIGKLTSGNEARKIEKFLQSYGLNTPPHEEIKHSFDENVRYFREEDSALAKRVASLMNDYLKGLGSTKVLKPILVKGYNAPGQIEIWVD